MTGDPRCEHQAVDRGFCAYCGLPFSGPGCSPDGDRRFCCYGCYLVERIMGAQGEEGIASWIVLRLGLGAFLAMNVMMISLVLYIHPDEELGASAVSGLRWAMLVLSTPAVAILGAPYVLSGARSVYRGRRISTDVLVITGSLTAYSVSAVHVIRGSGHVYFDTATMLLLIVTIGRLMEASAKNRTSRAIRELVELAPPTARVLRAGEEVEIPSGEVPKGDIVVVRPGERVPVDGRIESGNCLIEEAAFTGEARPRSCGVGDSVFGGSVNCDGLIMVRATAVGADSLLAQIQRMVRQAQDERAPVERLVERVAGVFVPVVWLVALGAGLYWGLVRGDTEQAGMSALAVLVVACPCALGLATPMATCLALGRAARAGVLVRSGEVLERLPRISRVFFDKTGTITTGHLTVSDVNAAAASPDEVLALAASCERGSEHVIARAIVSEAEARDLEVGQVTGFRALPGQGVEGDVALDGVSRRVTVGSPALISRLAGAADLTEVSEALTTTCVAWDGAFRGTITFWDSLRPEAVGVVRSLQSAGIRCAIISGDREAPTRRLAAEVGVSDVLSDCTPGEKASVIGKARGGTRSAIAMVGDGINDAPALAQADVGFATGSGTDLARESSDVTLLGDDLMRIPWVLGLSKMTYRIIRQNLWWAFGYNSIAMTLAFFGYVHPLIAATAMLGSSIAVVTNSLRLMRVD